jgi:hypothetical protein
MRGDHRAALGTIEAIAAHSVLDNAAGNISGHMLYDADMKKVWQVLEGSPDVVTEVFERISNDSRHIVDEDSILSEDVDTRKYPIDWGMHCTNFEQVSGEDKEQTLLRKQGTSDLIQVKYKSVLKDQDAGQRLIAEEVVSQAVVKNAELEITGFMLYNDRTMTVYQVLEGPSRDVETLWEKIRGDPRHDVCAASVQRREVQKREFPHWSMAMERVERCPWSFAAAY